MGHLVDSSLLLSVKRITRSSRIICIALIFMLIFSVNPYASASSGIGKTNDIMADISGADSSKNTVYFGSQDEAMKWRVISNNSNDITLFYDDKAFEGYYCDVLNHLNWVDSTLCYYLNGEFLQKRFTSDESNALLPYKTTIESNPSGNDYLPNQKIVVPSVDEVKDGGLWGMSQSDRKNSHGWWLRTPGEECEEAAFVEEDGTVDEEGEHTFYEFAYRPLVKVNKNSIFFTSDAPKANKSKSVPGSSNMTVASSRPTGSITFTMYSSELNIDSSTTNATAFPGETIAINYSNAITGINKSVSVAICDNSDNILYYGRPVDLSNSPTNGTAPITIPSNLGTGSYKIKLFNEEVNGSGLTDFASTPKEIPLSISNAEHYTISLDVNGGNSLSQQSMKIRKNGVYAGLPTPTRANHVFDGWFTALSGGVQKKNGDSFTTNANETLYARWTYQEPKPEDTYYNVNLNVNGGNPLSPSTIKVQEDGVYSGLPTPQRNNYTFDGWYTMINGGTKVSNGDKFTGSSDITLYAHWSYINPEPEKKFYDITLNVNGGNPLSTSVIRIEENGKYQGLPTPTRNHYSFKGWFTAKVGGKRVSDGDSLICNNNGILYAQWTGTNPNLKKLSISKGKLNKKFKQSRTKYSLKLKRNQKSTIIKAYKFQAESKVYIKVEKGKYKAKSKIKVKLSPNKKKNVHIKVTAQNGKSRIYKIVVKR